MSSVSQLKHGTVVARRRLAAPPARVYEAWTALEHRRSWFAGPGWSEVERDLDLTVGGGEIARGRFPDGTETLYESRFHVIEPGVRLVYSFDMHVAGDHFSVSLAGVEFEEVTGGSTDVTYTEDGFFLVGDYDADSRSAGTEGLMDQFVAHVSTLGESRGAPG